MSVEERRGHQCFQYLIVIFESIISFSTSPVRWSASHMFTEFFLGAILVYLQLSDERAGRWSAAAAIISLVGK